MGRVRAIHLVQTLEGWPIWNTLRYGDTPQRNATDGDEGRGGIRPPGRCAPLMSPGPGCARPSSFTSLCTAPRRPDRAPLEHFYESHHVARRECRVTGA